jgi:mannose-6-phosphate isomerase-like protein (cupin superfamily)
MRFAPFLMAAAAALQVGAQQPAASPDPGVKPVRLIDRPEIRVSRVELQPGAVRSMHEHQDAKFHVWVALAGNLEFTMGSAKPVAAPIGQAYFMQKGTMHGFRNAGTTPGAAMEIFVKDSAAAGDVQALVAAFAGMEK